MDEKCLTKKGHNPCTCIAFRSFLHQFYLKVTLNKMTEASGWRDLFEKGCSRFVAYCQYHLSGYLGWSLRCNCTFVSVWEHLLGKVLFKIFLCKLGISRISPLWLN